MELIMRWIQISDIHFQTKNNNFNTVQLRKKLPEYLKNTIDGPVQALIFTGDYRYAPEGEENPTKVVDYILELAQSIGIGTDKIVTTPGNHDLVREAVRTAVIEKIRKDYSPDNGTIPTQMLANLQEGFKFYNSMHEKLNDASSWDSNPHCVIELEKCNLLILNTALTAGGDDDEGNLIIGSLYLDAAVSKIKNSKPIIAVGHHGFDFFDREEKKRCQIYFDQHNIRLYLCGHTHDSVFDSFGKTAQANCGCLIQEDNSVYAGFNVGELYDDGTVKIQSHKWDSSINNWIHDPGHVNDYGQIYSCYEDDTDVEKPTVSKVENKFSICGYRLLAGLGTDGIKYFWKKHDHYVESLAFNRRLKIESDNPNDNTTSAYTISTSIGCNLSIRGQQCKFCETGTKDFHGFLRAEDIALQCIFMAQYDSNCSSYPQLKDNLREFAFMGQGEPGFNYSAIRQAILLTDYAMEKINQKISRYIISSCGISEFMPELISDIKRKVFKNKVTVHFSLHTIGAERNELMPINLENDYAEFIKYCTMLHRVSGDKIGVGILMFNDYQLSQSKGKTYSLTPSKLEQILNILDKDVFRIDLCTMNRTSTGNQHQLSNEKAKEFLDFVKDKGYEGKLFTSFGDSDLSGCGMLSSSIADMEKAGNTTIQQFNRAIELLKESQSYVDSMLLES